MKQLITVRLALLILAGVLCASAVPITSLVSTGQAAPGNQDPNWLYSPSSSVFQSPYVTAANPNNGFPFYAWFSNDASSSWISPQPLYGSGVWGDNPGLHRFLLVFTLPANADPATATFSFRLAVDNALHSVWFNGAMIFNDPSNTIGYNAFSPVVTVGPGPGLFQAGNNYLDVFVINSNIVGNSNPMTWNPAGFRLEIVNSNVDLLPPPPSGEIPETSTVFMMALGLIGIGLARLRRQ